MINLKKESGLEISLTDNFKLVFNDPKLAVRPDVRYATDMPEVIIDQKIAKEKKPLYYMYRNIGYLADRDRAKQENLRYDLTILLPDPIGPELNKTKGHYHPLVPGGNSSYPEIYEVIYGRALFLIQRYKDRPGRIIENYLIEAEKGQQAVMPPDFGHVTINPGPEPLVMANWVGADFESQYQNYEILKGASYYLLKNDPYQIKKNPNYQETPKLERLKPKEQPQLGLQFGRPIYRLAKGGLTSLKFLSHPAEYDLSIPLLYHKVKD